MSLIKQVVGAWQRCRVELCELAVTAAAYVFSSTERCFLECGAVAFQLFGRGKDARRNKAKLRDMLNELNDGLTHIKDGGT